MGSTGLFSFSQLPQCFYLCESGKSPAELGRQGLQHSAGLFPLSINVKHWEACFQLQGKGVGEQLGELEGAGLAFSVFANDGNGLFAKLSKDLATGAAGCDDLVKV